MDSLPLEFRLKNLLSTRPNYEIYQENGQRFYKAVNWNDQMPQRGCEVFIGKLPRNCYEDEIVPLFEQFGTIYILRLMMDFSGTNRGYAFLTYSSREEAEKAIEFNKYEIRSGHSISILKSLDNCKLFVGNIPKHQNKEQILNAVKRATENVKDVHVKFDENSKRNRGFAFVEYVTHKDAAMARRILINNYTLWNLRTPIRVDWAKPKKKV